MSFRLSQRIALFLGGRGEQGRNLQKDVSKSYGWRSRVAHGVPLAKLSAETSEEILMQVELIFRSAMQRILLNAETLAKFIGDDREEYLDGLVFGATANRNVGNPEP